MQKEKTYKHRVKKSLGQNFLKSEPALRKIIEAGEIKKDDVILEIGPGKGALTKKLLERAGLVIAVEKDRELFEFLKTKFASQIKSRSLVLVHEDILKFEIKNHELRNYKIIANIPYNITGAILKKFLSAENQPERMVLMVQREVAKRITTPSPSNPSRPPLIRGGESFPLIRGTQEGSRRGGKESILSISVKAYGEPEMVMKVPKRYFSPVPKVDSAVIAIKNISRKIFTENQISEDRFWEIVKTGFAHKRKKLSSNLKNVISSEKLLSFDLKNNRAEDLSLENWIDLAKA